MRVSELVTIKKIKSWMPGDVITIKAGTGAGKSHFIKNNLYALAKKENSKILMLVHRSNCRDQFLDEIISGKKDDVVDIVTYQKLEYLEANNKSFNFFDYTYIVCDEFHYFMSDAAFNINTDLSLNAILEQETPIKIFMSATGDYMKNYLNKEKGIKTIDYELPIKYDFIKTLIFFNKDETLEAFIEEAITQKDKGIFFIQSATKAYNLYSKYKDHCLFNCSEDNQHYKYVDKEKINNMLKKERFEEQILITTTCLDTGVNIKDEELKHIVCDVKDVGVLIQCIGRKRLQHKNDKINLYVKAISNKALGGLETKLKNKVEKADYLREHSVKEYIDYVKREYDSSNIVFHDKVAEDDKATLKINELMYFKVKSDLEDIASMKSYGDSGYCKYLATLFGFKDKNGNYLYRTIEEDNQSDKLIKYLESLRGKRLYKDEQKELYTLADIKRNGKLMKSVNTLNACFAEENIPFRIESHTDQRRKLPDGIINPYYKKVYWIVKSACEEFGCEALYSAYHPKTSQNAI